MKKQKYQCWLKANLIEFAEYIRVDKAEIALLGAPSCKFVLYAYTRHRLSTQTRGHRRSTQDTIAGHTKRKASAPTCCIHQTQEAQQQLPKNITSKTPPKR